MSLNHLVKAPFPDSPQDLKDKLPSVKTLCQYRNQVEQSFYLYSCIHKIKCSFLFNAVLMYHYFFSILSYPSAIVAKKYP